MNVTQVISPFFATNTYVVTDGTVSVVIDPSGDADKLFRLATQEGRHIAAILLTHGHFDHIDALEALCARSGAPVYISEEDRPLLEDPYLNVSEFVIGKRIYAKVDCVKTVTHGQILSFGDLAFQVYATPGHTRGSVCYLSEDILFSGDTVFANCYGRDDLPNSAPELYAESIASISDLLKTKNLYSGHGRIKEQGVK